MNQEHTALEQCTGWSLSKDAEHKDLCAWLHLAQRSQQQAPVRLA